MSRALLLVALVATAAGAQTAPNATAPIGYKTVAEARAALEARDGRDVVVTHADGWITVNEPAAGAQWSFPPQGHYAYPSLLRRTVVREAGGKVTMRTDSLCETQADACARLVAEFEALNDRIVQAVKARRRGPTSAPGS